MKPTYFKAIIGLTSGFIFTSQTWAWGGRGHNTICESAVQLVQNKELKNFLTDRPHIMGHLCNIPDIYWKTLGGDLRRHGDSAHYIETEPIGIQIKDLPTDLNKVIEKYTGADNVEEAGRKVSSVPLVIGHSWWRVNQLYTMAMKDAKTAASSPLPKNGKEEQDNEMAYNKSIYNMMVAMGIMGHYVGDNSQPFHTTSDYDGYAANHGGIHGYYEEGVVAQFGEDLEYTIVKKARAFTAKEKAFITKENPIEKMKALSIITHSEIKDVYKVDPIKTPSVLKLEKGMKLKTPAVRESEEVGYKKFNKMISTQMARSALLLANLWDALYVEAGKPDLKAYKSYLYPFTPDFIMPDYYEIKDSETKTDKK